ncbi:MAG: heme ABC transporter permease [Arenicella sp.]
MFQTLWNTLKTFYHQLGSPREFYRISNFLIPWFGWLFVTLMIIGTYQAFFTAPVDYQQGESFRIIYVHVPAAWLSLFVYIIMAVAAAIGMIWRMKMAFIVTISSAPIGAAFTLIALVTGSLWGKPMWGTWWEWDARLTSELILLFLYIGVIALYSAFDNRKTAEKATAILCIVGVINIPIIHYSVTWWNSLHQGATVIRDGGPGMPASMLVPLLILAIAFKVFYGWVLLMRAQNQVLEQEQNSQWVQKMLGISQ